MQQLSAGPQFCLVPHGANEHLLGGVKRSTSFSQDASATCVHGGHVLLIRGQQGISIHKALLPRRVAKAEKVMQENTSHFGLLFHC